MATVASDLMTAEQFYEFVHRPENRDRIFELEDGEIVEMSRPGKKHGLGAICANASLASSATTPLRRSEGTSARTTPASSCHEIRIECVGRT